MIDFSFESFEKKNLIHYKIGHIHKSKNPVTVFYFQ